MSATLATATVATHFVGPWVCGWWFLLIPLFWITLFVILFAIFGRRWRRAAAENGYGPAGPAQPRPPGRGDAGRALREGRHRRGRVPRALEVLRANAAS